MTFEVFPAESAGIVNFFGANLQMLGQFDAVWDRSSIVANNSLPTNLSKSCLVVAQKNSTSQNHFLPTLKIFADCNPGTSHEPHCMLFLSDD